MKRHNSFFFHLVVGAFFAVLLIVAPQRAAAQSEGERKINNEYHESIISCQAGRAHFGQSSQRVQTL